MRPNQEDGCISRVNSYHRATENQRVNPAPDTSLRSRLLAFVHGLNVDPRSELNERTSLLQSGLLDSAAMLQLAEWIQREVGADIDLLQFDLSKEWETIAAIENFIQRRRHNQTG